MTSLLTRTNLADLEVRADGDGRTIFGVLVPYDAPTQIAEPGGSYQETFVRGAFNAQLADPAAVGRVKLLSQHRRDMNPLGRAVELRDDAAGLVGAFRVANTQAGDEALELVRDGALDAFSIGFKPIGDEWNSRRTEVVRRSALLRETSLVTFPAYAGAAIAGVRTGIRSVSPEDAARRLSLLESAFHV
jgi:HK97 family phage prohead protease